MSNPKLPNWAVLGLCRVLFGKGFEPVMERFIFTGPVSSGGLCTKKGSCFGHTLGSQVVFEDGDDGLPSGQLVNYDFNEPSELYWWCQEFGKYPGYTHCMWTDDWPSADEIALASAKILVAKASKQ